MVEPLLLPIPDACRVLGVGKTNLYKLVAEERLRIVKLGRLSRVPMADLRALAADLTGEGRADA